MRSPLVLVFFEVAARKVSSMPFPLAAAVLGGSIIGGLSNIWGASQAVSAQDRANATNVALALSQREWEEEMSNTAHQRAVVDLKAAGLNPMLAANAGANVPNVPAPRVEAATNAYSAAGTAIGGVAADAMMKAATVQNLKEQAVTQKTQQQVNSAQAASMAEDAKGKYLRNSLLVEQMKNRVAAEQHRGKSRRWLEIKTDVEDALDMINPFRNFNASQSWRGGE